MPSDIDRANPVSRVHGFRRNERGSAAVEFALVAPLFFALLFAILETGLMFFADQSLQTATQDAARLVLTGQAQAYTQDQFKAKVCEHLSILFDCDKLSVDVQKAPSGFSSVDLSSLIDKDDKVTGEVKYAPGGAGDVVVMRLFYEWPLFVTSLGYNVSNLADGNRLLVATAAFKNEPFQDER